MERIKNIATLVPLLLSLAYVGFLIADRYAVWDRLRGLDSVEEVAANFETSYAANASSPVRPGDKAWIPLLNLIYRYSHANIPRNREPHVVARFQAVWSSKLDLGPGQVAEWTAPSTPFALLYKDWPGNAIEPKDYRIVGTIGDLRNWIDNSKDRLRFLVGDVFVATFSSLLGIFVWLIERERKSHVN